MEQLYLPIREGGLKLLNITARNKAIDIMMIQSYLNFEETRPRWAYLADHLIAKHVTSSAGMISPTAQINTFIQTWSPGLHPGSKLPISLKRALKTAKELRVSLEAVKVPVKKKGNAYVVPYGCRPIPEQA